MKPLFPLILKTALFISFVTTHTVALHSSVESNEVEDNIQTITMQDEKGESKALPFNTKKHRMKKIKKDVNYKDTGTNRKRGSIFSKLFGGNEKQKKQNTSTSTFSESKPSDEIMDKPVESNTDNQFEESFTNTVEKVDEKSIFKKWFKFLDKDETNVREKKSTANPFDTKNHRRGMFTQEADPTYVEKDYDPETTTSKSSSAPFDTKKHRRVLFKQEADPTYLEKDYEADRVHSTSTAEPFDTKKHRKKSNN